MKKEKLDERIVIRISTERKEKWKKICKQKGLSTMTSLIYYSINNTVDYEKNFRDIKKRFNSDQSPGKRLNELVKWIHINQRFTDEQLRTLKEIIEEYGALISERTRIWKDICEDMKRRYEERF